MATVYKTPGVYVEEISTLPPSIAEVETAIPAFIGYTEFRKDNGIAFGKNIPRRIESMLEYVEMFGGPYREEFDVAITQSATDLTPSITVTPHFGVGGNEYSPYTLYYQMKMYFANGGGKCYVVSVGTYDMLSTSATNAGKIVYSELSAGMEACRTVDEITLLVAPESVLISKADRISLYGTDMLAQCADLQDRFAIMDVVASELGADADQTTINTDVNNFREEVGADNLKYGAGYFPPVKTSLNYNYDEGLVHLSGTRLGAAIPANLKLAQLVPGDAEKASGSIWVHDNSKIVAGQTISLGSNVLEFDDQITMGATASQSATNIASAINALADFDASAVGSIVYITASATGSTGTNTKNYAALKYSETDNPGVTLSGPYLTGGRDQSSAAATGTITISNLANLTDTGNDTFTVDGTVFKAVVGAPGAGEFRVAASKLDTATNLMNAINDAGLDVAAVSAETVSGNAVITLEAKVQGADGNAITLLFTNGGGSAGGSVSGATLTGGVNTIDSDLYSMVKNEIAKQYAILYPSASIAGIYARVDNDRGVWKAPANVGVRKVQGLAISLTDALQENLNVDATTGKSINALRTFKGKGTLVWGARTLAGNDNEWRYVPVRRFYNMVEESIKKATEFVVFEPNDAKTWMRVKTMCENFLTRMWQQGALAGAKPADAFFVNVGLGITMTAQDILEGRMNVEIGMAAVRPAEFIILKFSHKLAVS